jgi:hypothetical protein
MRARSDYPHPAGITGQSVTALPPFWNGDENEMTKLPYTLQVHEWFGRNRHAFADVLARLELQPAKALRDLTEEMWSKSFASGDYVLGIHLRGSDKQHSGGIVPPSTYYVYVDSFMAKRNAKLFVATDSPRFLKEVVARYGEGNVKFLNCMRDEGNAAWNLERDGYVKGREVMVDAMMLAKCDFLIYSHSGVPEFALRLNTKLHDHSINVSFDPTTQFDLESCTAKPLQNVPVGWLHYLRRQLNGVTFAPVLITMINTMDKLRVFHTKVSSGNLAGLQASMWIDVEKKKPA